MILNKYRAGEQLLKASDRSKQLKFAGRCNRAERGGASYFPPFLRLPDLAVMLSSVPFSKS